MRPIKELYPRKCDNCGKGMHEGYYMENDGVYFCGDECLTAYLYKEDMCYYTQWDNDDVEVGEELYTRSGEEVIKEA